MKTGDVIRSTCIETLDAYRKNPWAWLRESDLVVDMVTSMRSKLDVSVINANPVGTSRALFDERFLPLMPRIRTEVKVRIRQHDNHSDNRRVDVCIYSTHAVDIYFGDNGVRDVTLPANENDIDGVVEVKLYPQLYLPRKKGSVESGWLNDVIKLYELSQICKCIRHYVVIFIDTSLPISTCGMRYARSDWAKNRYRGILQSVPESVEGCWPIPARGFSINNYRKDDCEYSFEFIRYEDAGDDRSSGGITLYAIGVDDEERQPIRLLNNGDECNEAVTMKSTRACSWAVKVKVNRD